MTEVAAVDGASPDDPGGAIGPDMWMLLVAVGTTVETPTPPLEPCPTGTFAIWDAPTIEDGP
jgi:hypothetical protein